MTFYADHKDTQRVHVQSDCTIMNQTLLNNLFRLEDVYRSFTETGLFQLDPYMDDNFITSAFASMGEAVVSIKLIKNRATGSVYIFFISSFMTL